MHFRDVRRPLHVRWDNRVGGTVTLFEMLDNTLYYGNVLIYSRNAFDQCVNIFKGTVSEARRNEDYVWSYLMQPVDQWICGNGWTLIYVKNHNYDDRLETQYVGSEKWTRENHPYKSSYEVEEMLIEFGRKGELPWI